MLCSLSWWLEGTRADYAAFASVQVSMMKCCVVEIFCSRDISTASSLKYHYIAFLECCFSCYFEPIVNLSTMEQRDRQGVTRGLVVQGCADVMPATTWTVHAASRVVLWHPSGLSIGSKCGRWASGPSRAKLRQGPHSQDCFG